MRTDFFPMRCSRTNAAVSGMFLVFVPASLFYIAFCSYLYLRQDSLIFHPEGVSRAGLEKAERRFPGSLFYLKMKDGTVLQGFDLNRGRDNPLVFYFGGNSVEASRLLPVLSRLKGFHLVMTNYRGFGRSGGRPGQSAIYSDALEVYDHFCALYPLRPKEVFLIGRSLGSAVAIWVARMRRVTAVVLVTPFDSVEMLARRAYPWVPVSLLLRDKFKAIDMARDVDVPLLVLLADHDSTVPRDDSMNLIRSWKGKVRVKIFSGAEHGTIMDHPGLLGEIRIFFDDWTRGRH